MSHFGNRFPLLFLSQFSPKSTVLDRRTKVTIWGSNFGQSMEIRFGKTSAYCRDIDVLDW